MGSGGGARSGSELSHLGILKLASRLDSSSKALT
jgi:hypothetical protein